MSRLAVVVLAAALVSGAGIAAPEPPVSPAEWQPVLADWLAHGNFTRAYPCPVAVVARLHAPPAYKERTPLVHALDLYELAVCPSTAGYGLVRVGMSNRRVAEIAGVPVPWDSAPQRWVYRSQDGQRWLGVIQFDGAGYVTKLLGIGTAGSASQ